ncbi:MAG: hypothetical protein PHF48_04915 [Bacteroidales bacterium]|nr:hypothetical protein [Bacteroidales bacterium]
MKSFRYWLIGLLLFLSLACCFRLNAQSVYQLRDGDMQLIYFGQRYDYVVPHVVQTFHNAMHFHRNLWQYEDSSATYVVLSDFEDMGHGGALVMPFKQVQLGISPYSFAFSIIPSNERFQWLFNHELTHVVMADKANKQDLLYRKLLQGRIRRNEEKPLSAIWSYLTTPRWYAPRWFHEGIACFMETWMSGGLGRAMGTYDEMYFRSIVSGKQDIYSLIGLETEGTTIDFQVGANAYLYGTRFITYLAYRYGTESLFEFYNRTDSSKSFYANQFRQVYNKSIHEAWKEWMAWEKSFQQDNIDRISAYPLTDFRPLCDKPLGNVSRTEYNPATGKLYAAINYPGIISQIAEIDVKTGKKRKLATLDSPELYYSTNLAYNPDDEKIYITEQNSKYRSLVEVDVKTGKKKTLLPFSRTGNLVFNSKDKSLWGVRHDNGNAILVKIPQPYNQIIPLYTAPFGRAIFDLDISDRGDKLLATLSGVKGEQSLILFDIQALEQGSTQYETLYELEDNTLTQFRFTNDDQYLIGTSYYTGVSNIWRLRLEDKAFELMSNTETGFFMPLSYKEDSLLVLRFERDGMLPGIIPAEVLNDANAIDYLGNLVHQRNPVVEEWSLPPASKNFEAPSESQQKPYRVLREMKFAGIYPDLGGFKETAALGLRLNWRDPLGLSNMELFVATSPWSANELKQKFHLMFDWSYWNWHFSANYNPTHFYDLFGPTKRSRAGYNLGLDYNRSFSLKHPFRSYYEFGIYTYGMLEVLPQYQNIASPIRDFQAATAGYGLSKLRKSLGGVDDEQGYSWDITASSYLAQGGLYPSFVSNQDLGFLLPGMRNTSFWIRNSIGQSLGDRSSGLSYFYFGGFRNNYVDWQPSGQYRKALAFPGAEIDEIKAYNYIKTMGELNLRPLRLRNVGTTWLYPTYIKSSLFGTHLMTNFDRNTERAHLFNAGVQLDLQLVMFSYLKTTWSLGYARMMQAGLPDKGQWMLSLKLLGD